MLTFRAEHTPNQTDGVFDMKMKLEPVKELLLIIQADGTALQIIGSAIIFLESDNLKGRRMLECAVIDGNGSRETLISLEYLRKWGILHETFPYESLEDFLNRKYLNKSLAYYTDVFNLKQNLYSVDRTTREPSQKCKDKREEILKKWSSCFKENLEKGDRFKHDPIKIKLKEKSSIPPSHCSRPYDMPFHLRKAYTKELKNCLDAEILEKCGMEPSQWASKAFPSSRVRARMFA